MTSKNLRRFTGSLSSLEFAGKFCFILTISKVLSENGEIKAYGAGILSSFGELEYCKSDKPKILPFQPEVTSVTPYPITTYQPTYFVTESFEDAKRLVKDFAKTLKKPVQVQYNPYTESVEILDNIEQCKNIADEVKSQVEALSAALKRMIQ